MSQLLACFFFQFLPFQGATKIIRVEQQKIASQQDSGRCAAQFHHFYLFLCAIVRDNYSKIKRFIVKIQNLKSFLRKYQKCAKKSAMQYALHARIFKIWESLLNPDIQPISSIKIFDNIKLYRDDTTGRIFSKT